MNINIFENEEKTTFALSGKLDTTTAPKLEDVLVSELRKAKHVELDFAELIYVSSAGLRVLLLGEKTAKVCDSRQTIVNISSEIMEVFDMTGFSEILHLE